jgi:hypothetical protein
VVDEFLVCICGSEEAKKAPERTAREENPDCGQHASGIACAGSQRECGNRGDHKTVKHAQSHSASFTNGLNVQRG